MRTKGDRDRLVQMLMNGDPTTGQRRAQLTALELPDFIGEARRVIAGYHPFVLQREDQVKILAPERHKSSPALTGGLLKRWLNCCTYCFRSKRFAWSRVLICSVRSSGGRRPSQVLKPRLLLPPSCA